MLTLFSFFVFCFFYLVLDLLFICIIYIFLYWEFGIPNSQIPNSVIDLNFGLFYPLLSVSSYFRCICLKGLRRTWWYFDMICAENFLSKCSLECIWGDAFDDLLTLHFKFENCLVPTCRSEFLTQLKHHCCQRLLEAAKLTFTNKTKIYHLPENWLTGLLASS